MAYTPERMLERAKHIEGIAAKWKGNPEYADTLSMEAAALRIAASQPNQEALVPATDAGELMALAEWWRERAADPSVPEKTAARFARVAEILRIAASQPDREAVANAFEAGALAVHREWVAASERGEAPPRGDPEFTEAARDYALSLLSVQVDGK